MDNVDNTIWLYNFLSIGLLRVAQKTHRELDPVQKGMRSRATFLLHFLVGAVTGIDKKIERMKFEHEKSSEITALILVNKEALTRYKETQLGPLKTSKARIRYVDSFAYNKGIAAGEAFSIGKPVTTAPEIKKLS